MRSLTFVSTLLLLSSIVSAQVPKPKTPDAGWWERMEYELSRTVDPKTGELPPDIKQREYEFTSTLPTYHRGSAFKGNRTLGIDWSPIGPTEQPGRTRTFAIDVNNANNFLAGSASGGVWRSIDRGASWVKVTPVNEMQTISSLVQDIRPGKTNTWYYGTSELLSTTNRRHTTNIRTHGYGNGIYRSTDNGATWAPLESTQTRDGKTAPVSFQGVWKLALDHTSEEDVIYAACQGGIMRSTNGGADWTLVLGSETELCFNADIVIAKNGMLYAALGSIYTGFISPKQGIWRSSNGIDWEKISDGKFPQQVRRVRLAVAPSADTVVYAFIEWPKNWSNPDGNFGSNSKMIRYGSNVWTNCTLPENGDYFTLTGYAMAVTVHPTDPNMVFFGGTDTYRSYNGVKNFEWIGGYVEEIQGWLLHPDIHDLVIDPRDPNTLYVATDGGIYSSSDYGELTPEWYSYHNGLETSQIYDVKLDNATPGSKLIACGLQDNNSYVTRDPSGLWEISSGGDGMTSAIINGDAFFATSSQGGYISFFGYEDDILNYYGYGHPAANTQSFTFFTRYLVEPLANNALYLPEGNELWVLDNLQSIPAVRDVDNQFGWSMYTYVGSTIGNANVITSLAASTQRATIFLGTSNGKIYELADAFDLSAVPENISSSQFPIGAYLAHIEVDPLDDKHIIAVFSNYNIESIFRTTNGGETWDAISGNLEELPEGAGAGPSVRTVKILHTASGINYFAGTTSGLFSTNTLNGSGTQWAREGATNIGNLIVESIDVRQSDGWIVSATQGGGIFAGNGGDAGVEPVRGTRNLVVEQSYPNPMRDESELRFTLLKGSTVTVELFDVLGKKLSTLSESRYDSGTHALQLTSKGLVDGTYFCRLTAGNESVTRMFSVLK